MGQKETEDADEQTVATLHLYRVKVIPAAGVCSCTCRVFDVGDQARRLFLRHRRLHTLPIRREEAAYTHR